MNDLKELDNLILAEVNVKMIIRKLFTTEIGDLVLQYDGNDYSLFLGGQPLHNPNLLNKLIHAVYRHYSDKESI